MSKELDNVFTNVRNAFRLLYRYQNRALNIINYIREQTPYTDMWGGKWYSNPIGTRRDSPDKDYANLRVWKDMWAWDFLYGYLFEYYFGTTKINKKDIEMSVMQVSDDGYFLSHNPSSSLTDLSTFADAEDSHSYIVLNVGYNKWMSDDKHDEWWAFLCDFISGRDDFKVIKDEKSFFITKRYPMQKFSSQPEADKVIRDFGKLVYDSVGIKLFKESFFD